MSDWIPIKLVEQSMAVRDAEIAELKAELRKKAIDSISDIGQLGELSAENVHLKEENARLKAEVERLTAELDQAECDHDNCQKRKVSIDNHRFDLFTENKNLKAEVERLRKAGDAVCESPYALETDPAVIEWRAAKEGKPSV